DRSAAVLGRRLRRCPCRGQLRLAGTAVCPRAGADARHRRRGRLRGALRRHALRLRAGPRAQRRTIRGGPRPAPELRRGAALAARCGGHAGRRGGGVRMTAEADRTAWPPAWARDLVPRAADVDEAALYLALEAGGWPAADLPRGERRAFALVVLA